MVARSQTGTASHTTELKRLLSRPDYMRQMDSLGGISSPLNRKYPENEYTRARILRFLGTENAKAKDDNRHCTFMADWNAVSDPALRSPPAAPHTLSHKANDTLAEWLQSNEIAPYFSDERHTYEKDTTDKRAGWAARLDDFYTSSAIVPGLQELSTLCFRSSSVTEQSAPHGSDHRALTLTIPLGNWLSRPPPIPTVTTRTTRWRVHKLTKEAATAAAAVLDTAVPHTETYALLTKARKLRHELSALTSSSSHPSSALPTDITHRIDDCVQDLQNILLRIQEQALEVIPNSPPREVPLVTPHRGRLPNRLYRPMRSLRQLIERSRTLLHVSKDHGARLPFQRFRRFLNYRKIGSHRHGRTLAAATSMEEARAALKTINNTARKELRSHDPAKRAWLKNHYINSLAKTFAQSHKKAYKMILGGDSSTPFSATVLPSGKISSADEDIIQAAQDYYFNLTGIAHINSDPPPWSNGIDPIKLGFNHDANSPLLDSPDSTWKESVKRNIRRLPTGKAPGPEGIFNETLRLLPDHVIEPMALVFRCLSYGYVPSSLTESETVLIFKGGDKSPLDLKNFRPIALLPTVYKLYSGTLNRILIDFLEENGLLCAAQSGFRPAKHTGHQILWLMGILEDASMSQQDIHLVYVDFLSAFNTVSHEKLDEIYGLLGIPADMRRAIQGLMAGASTRVTTSSGPTDSIPIRRGNVQGDVISPTCFACFIEPLLRWLEAGDRGYKPGLSPSTSAPEVTARSAGKRSLHAVGRVC